MGTKNDKITEENFQEISSEIRFQFPSPVWVSGRSEGFKFKDLRNEFEKIELDNLKKCPISRISIRYILINSQIFQNIHKSFQKCDGYHVKEPMSKVTTFAKIIIIEKKFYLFEIL